MKSAEVFYSEIEYNSFSFLRLPILICVYYGMSLKRARAHREGITIAYTSGNNAADGTERMAVLLWVMTAGVHCNKK